MVKEECILQAADDMIIRMGDLNYTVITSELFQSDPTLQVKNLKVGN